MSTKSTSIVLVIAGLFLIAIVISFSGPPLFAQDGGDPRPTKTPTGVAPVTPIPPDGSVLSTKAQSWSREQTQWVITYTVAFTKMNGLPPVGTTMRITSTPGAGLKLVNGSWHAASGKLEAKGNQLIWSGTVVPKLLITFAAANAALGTPAGFSNTAELCCVKRNDETEKLTATDSFTLSQAHMPIVKNEIRKVPPVVQPMNGNFEGGPGQGWTQLVNDQPGTLIFSIDQYPVAGPVGRYYAWLGGVKSKQEHALKQIVTLPFYHSGLVMTFDYWLASLESDCANSGDSMQYGVVGLVQTGPIPLCSAKNTFNPGESNGWTPGELALGPGTGKTIEIFFAATLDGDDSNSNFLVDNVKLCSTDPDARAEDKCP